MYMHVCIYMYIYIEIFMETKMGVPQHEHVCLTCE